MFLWVAGMEEACGILMHSPVPSNSHPWYAHWIKAEQELQDLLDGAAVESSSVFAGTTQASADGPARELAWDAGNNIITISEADTAEWIELAQPVYDKWVADMDSQGIDGQALIDEARALMEAYKASN